MPQRQIAGVEDVGDEAARRCSMPDLYSKPDLLCADSQAFSLTSPFMKTVSWKEMKSFYDQNLHSLLEKSLSLDWFAQYVQQTPCTFML